MNWISVKDALPNKNVKVLFAWVYDELIENMSMGYLCDNGWDIYLPYNSFKLNPSYVEVTHWMPLPDYPKKECFCGGTNGLGECNCKAKDKE